MPFSAPRKIEIKYDTDDVQNMLNLLKAAPFPERAAIDASPWKLGIEYDYLKSLKSRFEKEWSWTVLEKKLAKYDNYLVHYEDGEDSLDLHYVYAKSTRSDAIPLILLHGWPGTFYAFQKVIEPLVNPSDTKFPAFHVVIPSIPGYFLSTLSRRDGFGINSMAKLFNGLMTEVLGYNTYAGQGGDWGYTILRAMGCLFPEALPVMHFNSFVAPAVPGLDVSTLSDTGKHLIAARSAFSTTGNGYFMLQSTKPFTIGIAIASSPLSILTYIAEKMYSWSDTARISQEDIIDIAALYWLSKSFSTAVVIYNQSTPERSAMLTEPKNHIPRGKMGYSAFRYEIIGALKSELEAVGSNLVYYKERECGGHFPSLDSPNEFVEEIQEFFSQHWN